MVNFSYYKKSVILISGIVSLLIGISLVLYSRYNKYNWKESDWSDCINNKQKRVVTCVDSDGNIVTDNNCTDSKPLTEQDCKTMVYDWNKTKWSDCVGGKQKRVVTCVDSDGNTVDDSKCTNSKPVTQQDCKITPTRCDGCGKGNICLQKNGQPGSINDHNCVPCQ